MYVYDYDDYLQGRCVVCHCILDDGNNSGLCNRCSYDEQEQIMSEQNPIMNVVGIRKSEGDFDNGKGKTIEYSNTVVTVLVPFTQSEIENGAVGMKAVEHKIKGGQFFHDYQRQPLPAQAEMLFHCDFSGKIPKALLVGMNFLPFKTGIIEDISKK